MAQIEIANERLANESTTGTGGPTLVAVETAPAAPAREAKKAPSADGRGVQIRSCSLRSVFRLAVSCWGAVAVMFVVSGLVVWVALGISGVGAKLERFVGELVRADAYRIETGPLLLALVLAAIAFLIAATTVTVAAASFYNLMARASGGIELVLVPSDSGPGVEAGDPGS